MAPLLDEPSNDAFNSVDPNSKITIPAALERSEIPHYFRQFRDASVLKKLAHRGTGPLYQLIGRKAWYETADIVAWLQSRKKAGPRHSGDLPKNGSAEPAPAPLVQVRDGRGRPTKTEQRRRRLAEQGPACRGEES